MNADLGRKPAAVGRLEKRKQERRLRIYEAAVELFRRQGFERTTVNQIAEVADVVPATFFNHFQSKNAVLRELTGEALEAIELMLEQEFEAKTSTRECLTGFVSSAAERISETRDLARDVLLELIRAESPGKQPPYIERIHEPFAALVRKGQERGDVRRDQDAAFLAEMVVGILNATITNWLANRDYPIEQRLRQAVRFAWEAICTEPGSREA